MSRNNNYKTTVVTATGTLTQALAADPQRCALLIFNVGEAELSVSLNGADSFTLAVGESLKFLERAPINAVHVKGSDDVLFLTA